MPSHLIKGITMPSEPESAETKKIRQANESLKTELMGMIDQMEAQIARIQQQRQERFSEERKARQLSNHKREKAYMENTHRLTRLKKEVD